MGWSSQGFFHGEWHMDSGNSSVGNRRFFRTADWLHQKVSEKVSKVLKRTGGSFELTFWYNELNVPVWRGLATGLTRKELEEILDILEGVWYYTWKYGTPVQLRKIDLIIIENNDGSFSLEDARTHNSVREVIA